MKRKLIYIGILISVAIGVFAYINFLSKPYFLETHINPLDRSAKQESFDYKIVFLGDSMFEILGNFDELKGYLKNYYPDKKFLLLNYGYGSTNILSAQERLDKETFHIDRKYQAINEIDFTLILIESFGHNPLSEYSLEEGLKKQEEALDKFVATITQKHPKSSILFVATIAPNSKRYGEGMVNLLPEQRKKWADERSAYIKNHIEYAKTRGIPLVNIYEKSLKEGDGNIDYIDTTDFIHPSPGGVYLISETIAKFIFENKLLVKQP